MHVNTGTFFVRSSSNGLTSEVAKTLCDPWDLASIIFDHRSSSSRALTQDESTCPSEIVVTTAGAMEISSIAGPRSFSTTFRFSSLVFMLWIEIVGSLSLPILRQDHAGS